MTSKVFFDKKFLTTPTSNISKNCLESNIEFDSLKKELEAQSKVNSDLKRLLVASMGDDLHNKIEALVRTRVHLVNEVEDFSNKMVNDMENIEKLSVEADLWFSKYQAANLLVQQVSSEKERILNSHVVCVNALQHVILEREILFQIIFDTHRILSYLSSRLPSNPIKPFIGNTVEIANINKHLASKLLSSSSSSSSSSPHPPFPSTPLVCLPPTHQIYYTYAETLALDALKHTKKNLNTNENLISRKPLQPRFHPQAKFRGIVLNCCKKCNGQIVHV